MKKTRRIMGVGLVLALLVSMLLTAVPVSAGTLSWSVSTDIPDGTDKVVVDGTTLYDMAVSADGQTIYVAAYDNGIYKSVNGGDSWSAVSIPSAVTGNITMVAMAPDDSDVVVFVGNVSANTTNLTAYVTTNGFSTTASSLGTIQDSGGTAAVQIYDVAISAMSGSTRYIACAGKDATAALYYFNLGSTTPVWKDAAVNFTTALPSSGLTAFHSVAFSPNFASDQVMVAVSANISGSVGAVNFHIASFNQQKWDADVFTGYPKAIISGGNLASVEATDISLDPEYLAGDDATRIAMVGAAFTLASTAEGGLYRLKNTTLKELKADTAINSVAWDGVNLAAGAYASNDVYRCADALASSPTVSGSRTYKEIGITGTTDAVRVLWGDSSTLLGVKRGTSSAFARSTDNGKTWNDIALIDTTLDVMEDLWVSPDGSVTYLLTQDATDDVTSLWVKASAWKRIFCIANTNGHIVRAAASNPDVIYIADDGDDRTAMYYTTDGGTVKWVVRASRYDIADLAVQDADVAYVAHYDNDEVSKTTNGGFTWGADVDSKAAGTSPKGRTLTLIADDELLLGTSVGTVSYSSDGNSSWTKIGTALNKLGNAQVTASGLATDDYIYAAADLASTRVERWTIGQSGTTWKNLAAPVVNGDNCTGLLLNEGTLYAMSANATASSLHRTLSPTSATPSSGMWVTVTSTANFDVEPSALRLAAGSSICWALDSTPTTNGLWSFTDTLAAGVEIDLVSPVANYENPTNPVTGLTQDISFKWNKPSSGTAAVTYQVRIKGADGATTLLTATRASTDSASPNLLIGPDQTTNKLNFTPGQTYFWQVRSTVPVFSPWSALRAFTIAELPEVVPPVVVTQVPAPAITVPAPVTITQVPAPNITVTAPAPAPATTITIPAPAVPAPITPAFIWAIIIIGAILVIAVVVLIVRTRRTV